MGNDREAMSTLRFSRAPLSSRNAVRPVKQKVPAQRSVHYTTEMMSEKIFGGKLLLDRSHCVSG